MTLRWVVMCFNVAPFAGAWIETLSLGHSLPHQPVAPFAGAWIETRIVKTCFDPYRVAPFAGAWIETLQHIYSLQHI